MRFLLLVMFSYLASFSGAQTLFQKTYGKTPQDYAYNIVKTYDGNFVISGLSNSFSGTPYLFLFKTDQYGDTLWSKGFSANSSVNGNVLEQTSDSGLIVSGNSGIMKMDKDGTIQWTLNYPTVYFYSAQQTSDGGYILSGAVGTSNSSNGEDVYLLKLDAAGTRQWSRKYGGPQNDYSNCIRATNDGGYISCGGTASFGGGWEVYLIKTDGNGDTLWTKTYGGTGTEAGYGVPQSLLITADGGFLIGTSTSSYGAGGYDAFLFKTDALGAVQWCKTYGAGGNETIVSLKATSDGGLIFTGTTNSFGAGSNDVYLVKTTSLGDTVWTRAFGGAVNDAGEGIVETNDKGFAIAGSTISFGGGNNDAYLIRTDSLGNSSCNQFNTITQIGNPTTAVHRTPSHLIFITINIGTLSHAVRRGGLITDACGAVNVEQFKAQENLLRVFPNPSNDNFFIELPGNKLKVKVTVTDLFGNIVYCEECRNAEQTAEIKLQALANGTYFIKVETDKIYTSKILIDR